MKELFRRKSLEQAHSDAGFALDARAVGLRRNLSVWDLTSFGIAAVIGAGIFSTVGNASFQGGPAVVWLFVVTAVVCGFSAVCYAEFASQVPAAGSAYTYAYISLGELIAWIIGWDLIMEYAIGNIAVAISWGDYFSSLLASYGLHVPAYLSMDFVTAFRGHEKVAALLAQGKPMADALAVAGPAAGDAHRAWVSAPHLAGLPMVCDLPALAIVVLVTVVAYVGIRESKWASNAMVALKLVVILVVIAVGAAYVNPSNWVPFAPNGAKGVFKGVSAVFFAYIGFDAISTTAEECRDPQRDLPRGMFYSLAACTALYVAIAFVITGIVSYRDLQVGDPLAFVFGPKGANLPWISSLVSVSAVVAMASVLLVFQVGQPRIWMAMSRDGLLPPLFSSIHPRFQTPWFSTLMTGVMVAVPALFMNLTEVTDLTSIGTLFAFLLVCAGVVWLHERRKAAGDPPGARHFRVPIVSSRVWAPAIFALAVLAALVFHREGFKELFAGGDPVERLPMLCYLAGMCWLAWKCATRDWSLIPVLGLASCGYLITELGWLNWARFLVWLVVGMAVYFGYGRKNSRLNGIRP